MERRPLERCSSSVADRSKNLNAAVSVGSDIAHHKRRTPDELPGSMEGVIDAMSHRAQTPGGDYEVTKSIIVLSVLSVLALSTSFAQAGQGTILTNPHLPLGKTVSLACNAGHGDVAQTVRVTNTTGQVIKAGTKLYWNLNGQKGVIVLQSNLGAGQIVTDLAAPGNGGPCTATYLA